MGVGCHVTSCDLPLQVHTHIRVHQTSKGSTTEDLCVGGEGALVHVHVHVYTHVVVKPTESLDVHVHIHVHIAQEFCLQHRKLHAPPPPMPCYGEHTLCTVHRQCLCDLYM